MAKQDAAAVNTAGSGTQAPTLNFTTADIKGMSLTSGGALVITKTDGSSVTIENFKDLSQQGAKLTLADGQTIDTQKLFDTLSATGPLAETSNSFAIPNVDVKVVTLGLPQAGQTTQVTLEPGQTYVLGFDPTAAQTSMEGGNLVISFADGAKLIIAGFADVMSGSNPPVLTLAEGRVIDGIKLLDMARMNDMQEQKEAAAEKQEQQNIAQIAEELAKVEPAAGEAGGAAAGNRGGFGYQSAVEAAPLGAPAPVGPLGPTALAFGLPEFDYAPAADVRVATPSTAPSFETEDVQVKEDGSVLLAIEVSSNGVPNVNTTATITGIPSTWTVDPGLGTYDPATGTWTITLLGGGTFSGGPILHPPGDSDVDLPNLVVTVTNTNITTGAQTSVTGTVDVIVDAVADAPNVDGKDNVGLENTTLAVNITGGVTDNDGSETIVKYVVSGIKDGITFSSGTDLGNGSWEFTPNQLLGLTATAPKDYFGSVPLTVTVFSKDSPTDNEFDLTDNTNQATDPFTLTWKPVVNTPSIEANLGVDDAFVKEDGSIFVAIKAALDPEGSGNEILTVKVTGISADWTITNADGTYDAATGTWTITLPAGQNYNGGLTFAPPANSDVDLTGLVATATAFEPASGTSAQATDDFRVITDAVIDEPTLTVSNSTGSDNAPIALNIATQVGELDGSETITHLTITGVPAGATLSAGTYNAGTDTWTLSRAELTGLTMTPVRGVSDVYTLTVTTFAQETNLSGIEYDLTDNNAQKSATLTVTVRDDLPKDLNAPAVSVDETTLHTAPTVTVTNTLTANFGSDTPGSFAFTGTGPTGLTSGGKPVTVALSGTTYTATADGKTIFTMTLNATTGKYDFKLVGTLDHSNTADHDDVMTLNFGVKATDADGDAITGTVAVKVYDDGLTANDDFASVDASIRVVSGTVTPNDSFSQDVANKVSAIAFGSESKAVSANGETTINGANGTLVIKADGTYTYTLHANAGSGSTTNIALKSTDVAGTQNSVTLNGVTISIGTPEYGVQGGGDLVWVNQSTGQGVGISSGGSDKVWPVGEKLVVNPADLASTMKLTLSDLGNNVGDTINLRVFTADGQSVVKSFTVSAAEITNNNQTFTINSTDVGGKLIDRVEVYSPNSSFMLKDVGVTYPGSIAGPDQFTYTLKDGDGDTDTAVLTFNVLKPTLIVGENVDDKPGSTTPYEVGTGTGTITGGAAGDILVGDVGGSSMQNVNKDYNIVMMLDVSGSMGSKNNPQDRMYKLIQAVKNLAADLDQYQGGVVKIHFVPFSTGVGQERTFDLSVDSLESIYNYIGNLDGNGYTNYEAPMQAAIEWMEDAKAANPNADRISYFISDGEPNRMVDNNGNVISTNYGSGEAMDHIRGDADYPGSSNDDNVSEIDKLQTLSEVIGVGIALGSNSTNFGYLKEIDSDGVAINVQDSDDLYKDLDGASPLNNLADVGNDVLNGGNGVDYIFGDSINTDNLARTYGVDLPEGSGWAVFNQLITQDNWTEARIVDHIRTHAAELAHESVGDNGQTRGGGNDTIYGGDGNDFIFGQEGNDHIYGGAGNDTLYGGSGENTFHYVGNDGHDTIKDFKIGEGDVLDLSELLGDINGFTQAAINDFVFATTQNGNTVISVDVTGSGNVANAQAIATLQGVATTDLNDLLNAHTLQTNV